MENISLNPVKSKKAYMQIVEGILNSIHENKIEYGDKLYSEPELTKMLNVSRPTLREALRVLEFLGIVTVSPRKGIRINKPDMTDSYMPLIYMLMFEKTTELELFELRRAIQIAMAEAAARNRSEEELHVLEEIIKNHKEHINEDYEIFARLDYDFHQQVVKCSGNDMCFKLMETLNILMKKQMVETIYNLPVEDRKLTVNLHERVYESIRDQKPEQARENMQEHMERPYRFYKNKSK